MSSFQDDKCDLFCYFEYLLDDNQSGKEVFVTIIWYSLFYSIFKEGITHFVKNQFVKAQKDDGNILG
jgi:hypothetical protein